MNDIHTPSAATAVCFDAAAASIEGKSFADAAAAQMERMLGDFGRMYQERNQALQEVAHAHHEALFQLARAAEYRDDDTGVHIVRIGYLAWALALKMGQNRGYAALLRQAAPMHDVGKIGIADGVLKKPGGLTGDERIRMNKHSEIGAEILGRSRIPLFQLAAEVALTHHERWNGTGYPRGLAGEGIPLSGRIVTVVDFFDALTMDRCYRPAFPDVVALEMLAVERGVAFDPAVVDCFLAHADAMIELRDFVTRHRLGFADLNRDLPELKTLTAFA